VNKGLRKTLTSASSPAISSAPRPYISNNSGAVVPSDNDAIFERKIDLITEGIGSFFAAKLRELPMDHALTIVNYVISMRNEINLSDNYRKLNIYVLYKISKFFDFAKSYKEFVREDLLQYLESQGYSSSYGYSLYRSSMLYGAHCYYDRGYNPAVQRINKDRRKDLKNLG
jgi:hypothetical protein